MTALPIPKELDERLDDLVRSTGRRKSYYVRVAIAEWLEGHADDLMAVADLEKRRKRMDVLPDAGGAIEGQPEPQANWASLDLDNAEEVSAFSRSARGLGRRAVAEAIAKHKAIGNAICFVEDGQIIREKADGRRTIVNAVPE